MSALRLSFFLVLCSLPAWHPAVAEGPHRADVVIYGGTSAGVAAAVQVARMGKSVVVIEPGDHLGGLTTNGLGATDAGRKETIGGISREFYARIHEHYSDPASWPLQKPDEPSERRGKPLFDPKSATMWVFEPKVAQKIMDAFAAESGATLVFGERLHRAGGVVSKQGRIVSIAMESGRIFEGGMFLDATYEGDLLAAAGVNFHVGREANSVYGESINGVQKTHMKSHLFTKAVDPYVVPGNPASGLVPRVSAKAPGEDGQGDQGIQAFNFRMCMSNDPRNRTPFPKPEGYDEKQYELLFRNFEAGDLRMPWSPEMMPNHKTDTNNLGAFSTDNIGMNHHYAEATYEERARIVKEHEVYQKGLMWSLAHHPRVPEVVREAMAPWGLAADEFTGNGNWPRQIYVREARRMISDYVVSELDCRRVRVAEDSVGLGSYNMDSHNVQRYVTPEGHVQNEGDVQVSPGGPYVVSYRAIIPKRGDAENLLVPVCLSSSHIAYGSIRMEPVFMILGQSAATAAVMALDRGIAVQDLPYAELRERLLADGQILDLPPDAAPREVLTPDSLPGIVVDDAKAKAVGEWVSSTSAARFIGDGYRHDAFGSSLVAEEKSLSFPVDLPEAGEYEVRFAFPPNTNRSSRARIVLGTADGEKTISVDQRKRAGDINGFVSLGVFGFDSGRTEVILTNADSDGFVVGDAVQFLLRKK